MFVQFTVRNYKCFKEEAKLSLIASNYDKTTLKDENIIYLDKLGLKLLRSAVIYGANASGKTKLIEAMTFMKHFIFNSSKESQINEAIKTVPFRLSTTTYQEPSIFEIIFIHEEVMYRYGFEVDQQKVHAEWLYYKPKTKEVELFYREDQEFEVHKTKFKVKDLIDNDRIRPNALLLSVAASWNDQLAKKIFEWLLRFNVISGLRADGYEGYAVARAYQTKENKLAVSNLLKGADIGIDDIEIKKLDFQDLPEAFPDALRTVIKKQLKEDKTIEFFSDVLTLHKRYDENNLFDAYEAFSMEEEESEGTRKYFALSGPVLETLKNGEILIVDELANKLHPNLTKKLIKIFNSKDKNPNNAQLVFNAHDTGLLNADLFRRDQIWFTEKDQYGAVVLYALSDFKTNTVRKEDNFEKNYIKGRYGAVPYLSDFEKWFVF